MPNEPVEQQPRDTNRVLAKVLRAPWQPETWRATVYLCLGVPLGLAGAGTILLLGVLTIGLAVTVVLGLAAALLLLAAVRGFAAVQRSRHEVFFGERIAVEAAEPGRGRLGRSLARFRSDTTWRQLGYHLLAPVFSGAGLLVAFTWVTGALLGTVAFYAWALPAGGPFGWSLHHPITVGVLTGTGLGLFLAAPWLATGFAAMDGAAARALLGPNQRRELARRVVSLADSRAAAVTAADAERRRIERDLHDGAQQRLVSLAMKLGIARTMLGDLPAPARDAIANAHDEAKLALTELRDFVRGLHPAVLDDRGLDAALSGIAASSPLLVRLRVDLPRRPSAAVEAVAYFVVAEALTNATRHARATQVEVTVEQLGARLLVTVVDDGCGGARAGAGTGLRGLRERVATVDGTLLIDSPVGGPTLITAELPCA